MSIRTRLTVVALVCAFIGSARAAEPAASRPNIVVILADDLGFSDLGCYGSEIPTPNIDALAATGVRFTQFYNNSWCCPSRASLLTGRYPHQVGIGTNIDAYTKKIRANANSPAYSDELSKDSPTAPELLRQAGYRTMMVGKWHLGYRPDAWPARRGFDRSFALVAGAMNYWGSGTSGEPNIMQEDGEKYVPPKEGFFATDAFTDHAVKYIKEATSDAAKKPFFLYVAYNAPHWPLHAFPEDIAKHKGKYRKPWQQVREARYAKMKELGIIDERVALPPIDRGGAKPWNVLTDEQRDEWDLRMAVYAAMVERMDAGVGKVMAALREAKVDQNTLVIFLSDNGGAAEDPNRGPASAPTGTRDSFRGYSTAWASVSCTPFSGHKVTIHEGGISAPFIAHWPGVIANEKHGQFVREPAHLVDMLPSFLEIAGAPADVTAKYQPEGRSIVPMLKGNAGNADRAFGWEHNGHRGFRKGKWKIVRLPSDQTWKLYDVEADRAEANDLAEKQPDVLRDMVAGYDDWAKRGGVIPWEQIAPKP